MHPVSVNNSIRFWSILMLIMCISSFSAFASETAEEGSYDPKADVMHHIADANEWHITQGVTIPLPVILYSPGQGLTLTLSSKFHHGNVAVDGYVLDHGLIRKVVDGEFPSGTVHLTGDHHDEADHADEDHAEDHAETSHAESHDEAAHEPAHLYELEITTDPETGKPVETRYVHYNGHRYKLGDKYNLMNMFGGQSPIFIDFSITKNVAVLLIDAIILLLIFFAVAGAYRKRGGQAPKGLQSWVEPLVIFVRDDIARPNLGDKADKYLPYLMSVFFFIWLGNFMGLLPFIGNPNLTGNIAVTMALALITLFLTTIGGNKQYWSHIFTPHAPVFVWPILIPIEIIGILTKPFALMIRLFANITAGHIIVLSLASLVFVFGNAGQSIGGSALGAGIAIPFVLFMSLIELLVAFLQAFIFTILSALFIGLAVKEEAH